MLHSAGDLLEEVKTGIIVQQVNAQGVMGSGFAKAVKAKWPVVSDDYTKWIGAPYTQLDRGSTFLGQVLYVEVEPSLWVANIVGQQFFGKDGRRYTSYDALDSGFNDIAQVARFDIDGAPVGVHFPLIGCGLGGGDWTIVSAIICYQLGTIPHTLWVLPG